MIKIGFLIFLSVFYSLASYAMDPLFTYEGVLTDSSGNPITTSQTVTFQIIYSGSCIAYAETQTVIPGPQGEFSVIVGAGTGVYTGNTADRIFASSGTIQCSGGGSQTVSGFLPRSLRINVGGVDLTPDVAINNIPFAINAQRLGDKAATDFVQTTGGAAANMTGPLMMTSQNEIRFGDSGANYVSLKSPFTVGANVNLILPSNAGSANQVLTTDGAGILSWTTPAAGSVSLSGDVTGTSATATVAKIQGKPIVPGAYVANQVLRYNGTNWVNALINASTDLTGVIGLANGGTGATTAVDARTNLGLGTAATMNTGSGAGTIPVLGVALTANKLCQADGSATAINCTTPMPVSSQWVTNASDIYYMTGKVGIGTMTPAGALDVTGDIWFRNNSLPASILALGSGGATLTLRNFTTPNAAGTLLGAVNFSSDAMTPASIMAISSEPHTTTRGTYLKMSTTSNGASLPTERMRIDQNGNVGIGTTAPAAKLDVAGEVKFGNSGSLCSASNEGQQRYNSTSKRMEFCDGTQWIAFGGRTSCPTGFTLIGTAGTADAFCISTAAETSNTWLGATTNCRAKTPKARLCSATEWISACADGTPGMTASGGEWVAEIYSNAGAVVMGMGSCIGADGYVFAAGFASRCCLH